MSVFPSAAVSPAADIIAARADPTGRADIAGRLPDRMLHFKEDNLKRKTREALSITAEHAAHAIHILIAEGKLAAKDVTRALKRRKAMIRELRERLAALESGVASRVVQTRKAVPRKAGRKKPKLSAATRAKYRQQGRYLAAIRRLSKQDRARIKSIRTKAGAGAAINAAGEVARKKEIARSTRGKASTQRVAKKAAVARKQKRHPGSGTRPTTVQANTKKVAKKAAMATEQKQHPGTGTESRSDTSAPAQREEGHRLPNLRNPEHEARGPAGVLRDSLPQG